MDVRISSELLRAIVAEAAGAPGREVSGLLLGAPAPKTPVRPEPVEGRASGATACNTSFDFAQDERTGRTRPYLERVFEARSAPNVAADPTRAFEIDPASLFAAIRAERAGGPPILGHYHSHPNGSPAPSACDAAMADRPGRLWMIVANGEATLWREVPGGPVQDAFKAVRLVVEG